MCIHNKGWWDAARVRLQTAPVSAYAVRGVCARRSRGTSYLLCTKTIFVSGRGRESRASSEATVCLMSINAAPTFIFNLCQLYKQAELQLQSLSRQQHTSDARGRLGGWAEHRTNGPQGPYTSWSPPERGDEVMAPAQQTPEEPPWRRLRSAALR